MLANIVLLGLLTTPTPRVPSHSAYALRPRIEVWSNHGDGVYNRGQGVRVYIRADQDAFVTLFRVDTDGRVRVLFPHDPWEDNFVRGGHDFEVLGTSNHTTFYVDDYPGIGYLFGIVAADPFDYAAILSGDHWDYRAIADGRVRGDPYVALTELAERIVPEGYDDWDYDIVPYHVQQRYDYPRFLCYDCHAYASYPYWDPYWRSCVRFRVVYYDDPYYYPYRYYGGNVVFVRPYRPQPRYVFKDRDGTGRDQFVTREGSRPVNDNTRRTPTRSRTGSASFIPAPRDRPQAPRGGVQSGTTRTATGTTRSSGGGQDRADNSGQRRRPLEDQSQERQAPSRGERVQPSDRGKSGERVQSSDRGKSGERVQSSDRGKSGERGQGSDRPKVERAPAQVPRWEPTPRYTPPRETPRAEPQAAPQRERARADQPRSEPRAEPQREQPRAERPRAEPRSSESKGKAEQPELRRRTPG